MRLFHKRCCIVSLIFFVVFFFSFLTIFMVCFHTNFIAAYVYILMSPIEIWICCVRKRQRKKMPRRVTCLRASILRAEPFLMVQSKSFMFQSKYSYFICSFCCCCCFCFVFFYFFSLLLFQRHRLRVTDSMQIPLLSYTFLTLS